jgi:hypothetical protein
LEKEKLNKMKTEFKANFKEIKKLVNINDVFIDPE